MPNCILACITVVYIYLCRNNHSFIPQIRKKYSTYFTLFLSVKERVMDVIGYNDLGNKRKLHSKDCSFEQHLLGRNLLASPADENSICFRSLFPLNCITLRPLIFLLQREVVCCTIIYLSPLPTDQLESFIENAAPLRSYRLQAAYDFLWWIPLIDISLCKRNGRAKSILLLISYISQSLDLHNKSLHLLNIY